MPARLLSFLALLAVLLMPLGMSSPASAMATTNQHCPSEQSEAAGKSLPGTHCLAGCTIVLPQPAAVETTVLPDRSPPPVLAPVALNGFGPIPGTPPPKVA